VVYCPVTEDIYSAFDGLLHKNGKPMTSPKINEPLVGACSNFHKDKSLDEFFTRNNIANVQAIGSSLKFCLLAEGVLDIYPRFGPTSQWDTAAGQAISEAVGCAVVNAQSGQPLKYGALPIKNPSFVAFKKKLTWI